MLPSEGLNKARSVLRRRKAKPGAGLSSYKPRSGLFFFQTSQVIERSQSTIMAE
jgi:hypothetical protein